ncbi:hypothetical protein Tco_0883651 [Tanacetum coccineum]
MRLIAMASETIQFRTRAINVELLPTPFKKLLQDCKVLADSPVLLQLDQDASAQVFPTHKNKNILNQFSRVFEESPKTPHFHDDPLHESLHKDSTFQGSSSNVRQL